MCHLCLIGKNCSKLQILIGIMATFSENFIHINQLWPQLQPKTWSEAILRMYKSLHHFIIDSLQKCILEAAIDRLDIQLRTISPFNQVHGFSMILYIVRYVNAFDFTLR